MNYKSLTFKQGEKIVKRIQKKLNSKSLTGKECICFPKDKRLKMWTNIKIHKKECPLFKSKQQDWKYKWGVLVLDIFLKSKPKAQRYPVGQLEARGIEFIQQTLLQQKEEIIKEIIKIKPTYKVVGLQGNFIDKEIQWEVLAKNMAIESFLDDILAKLK